MRHQFTFIAVLLMLLAVAAYAQTNGQPERFTANAVSTSPQYGTGQQIVEITVDRWSPNAERERLVTALQTKGSDELLKQLQKNRPVGRIRTPDSLGYDLRYAQQTPLPDGGRMIVIATDRPIGFWEASAIDRLSLHGHSDEAGSRRKWIGHDVVRDADCRAKEQRDRAGGFRDAADHVEQHPLRGEKRYAMTHGPLCGFVQ
jgi:hypothetical protein